MFPIIDFRNGRYQGQIKNHLPDGIGILIDKNQVFCLAQWVAGEIKGPAVIIYPTGQTFCGHIAYQRPQQLCLHELAEDHVQMFAYCESQSQGQSKKIAAVLPLLRIILEIDNTDSRSAKVLNEYDYSTTDERSNIECISRILNLDSKGPEALKRHANCIRFMQEYFAFKYEDIIELLVNQKNGKKEYFFGLRGEGLGIKIEPLEQLAIDLKKTGRVYIVRGLGVFTRQNQMKDLGLKTIDNAMKGYVIQQGVFSIPSTLIKYEMGKRPANCLVTIYNYLKRSLHYRDKVIPTDYMYRLENFTASFNNNLRKVQNERLAQMTIEKPNNSGANLQAIQFKRSQKEREKEEYLRKKEDATTTPNPYNPNQQKFTNPQYNLQRAKDEIYRSVTKVQRSNNQLDRVNYKNIQYIDPNYRKVDSIQKQPRNYEAFLEGTKKDSNNKYNTEKDYVKELNQYYERKFTPKKYDTMDSSYSKHRPESRSPIAKDTPSKNYPDRSRSKYSPARGYLDRYRNATPDRNQNRNYTPSKARKYEPEVQDPRYIDDSLEYQLYRREKNYRPRQNYEPREDVSYESRRPPQRYDYYYDDYEKRSDADDLSRSPGRTYNQYIRSPSTSNLRKNVLASNRHDYD